MIGGIHNSKAQSADRWRMYVPMLLMVLIGCHRGAAARVPLHGHVSFKGESIADGKISFIPQSREKKAGAPISGFIQQGEYSFEAKDGPTLGSYRVEIEGFHKTGRQIPDMFTPLAPGQPRGMIDEKQPFVPEKFNSNSTLTADVTAETKELNFELKP